MHAAGLDEWFREMVEHKPLARKALDKLSRHAQMFGENQNVVSKIEFFERSNSAEKIRLHQETIVGLILDDMPHANKLGIASKLLQLFANLGRPQVHPSHHAKNKRRRLREV